jgi:kynurenine formamidase
VDRPDTADHGGRSDPPTLPEFEDVATHEGDGVTITRLHLETHCGTHMDAPTHLFPAAEYDTIDGVSPTEMLTEGVVVDCRDIDRGAAISRGRLAAATESVRLDPDDFVILDTGMDPTETPPEAYLHEYAYPSTAAAEFLLDREVSVVATDALGWTPRVRASTTTGSTGVSSGTAFASSRVSRTSERSRPGGTTSSARRYRTRDATARRFGCSFGHSDGVRRPRSACHGRRGSDGRSGPGDGPGSPAHLTMSILRRSIDIVTAMMTTNPRPISWTNDRAPTRFMPFARTPMTRTPRRVRWGPPPVGGGGGSVKGFINAAVMVDV